MRDTISKKRLAQIVREELTRKLNESDDDVDHKAIVNVASTAERLLTAIKTFKEKANDEQMAAMPDLDGCQETLENMVNNPSSYITKQKKVVKTVHLTPSGPNPDILEPL